MGFFLLFFFAGAASITIVWVQGTRTTTGTPYLTDAGTPLPYTGPSGVLNNNEPNSVRLGYDLTAPGFFGFPPSDLVAAFICEI